MGSVVFTVHGTNDGAESDTVKPRDRGTAKEKWWQLGSAFTEDLQRFWPVGEDPEIKPFRWTGKNSFRMRARAARALRLRIQEAGKTAQHVYVVGHSHGGNVIRDAARTGITGDTDKFTFITVGTPFLDVRDNPTPAYEIALLMVSLFAFLFGFVLLMHDRHLLSLVGPANVKTYSMASFYIGEVATFSFLGIAAFRWVKRLARPSYRKWLARFFSIYDQDDEALAFLKRSLMERSTLPEANFILTFFSKMLVQILLFILVVWALFYEWRFMHGDEPSAYAASFALVFTFLGGMVFVFLLGPILGEFAGIVLSFFWGPRIAYRVSRWFWDFFRAQVFGLDGPNLKLRLVGDSVNLNRIQRSLPSQFHVALIAFCEPYLASTWHRIRSDFRVREHIVTPYSGFREGEFLQSIFTAPSWNELIHTSYFKVPIIRKLVCLSMFRMARATPSAALLDDPDFAELSEAYALMAEPASEVRD